MNKLYSAYVDQVKKAVNLKQRSEFGNLSEARNFSNYEPDLIKSLAAENRNLEPKTGMHTLADLLGKVARKPFKGDHPDFTHLRATGGVDYHYIVSMFIDVKGSTHFHRKYDLEQIALIIQTIVVAATHTIALFDGHIQRLQYDGVFCYFGGKGKSKSDAVKSALDAASFFSYFIRYELKEVFEIEGIEDIYTRVGIDFGDDNDVQWVIFGTEECDELTTNSLHTSLAPKMQAHAKANGIVVGKNIWDLMGTAQVYTDYLRDSIGNVDESKRYIYKDTQKGFYYSQHTFDWYTYLKKTYWFISNDSSGNLIIEYSPKRKSATDTEQQQLKRLNEKSIALESGLATISKSGQIETKPGGTSVPVNRFYFDYKQDGQ